MRSSRSVFEGIFWTTTSNIINACYGFFSVPILLLYFGKQQYGLVGLAFSVNVYLKLMDMGFSATNVKFFSEWLTKREYEKVSQLFQSAFVFYGGIGLINAIVLLIVSIFAKKIFNLTDSQTIILNHLFIVLMISAFFGWISTLFDQFLRANEIIGWEQRLMIFIKIFQVLVLYITVSRKLNIEFFFGLTTLSTLVIIPFSILKINTLNYKIKIWPKYNHAIFKVVLPYSLSVFSFGIFQFSAVYLRPILLGLRSGVEAVADYRVLDGIANILILLGGSFMSIILPMATKVTTLEDEQTKNKIAFNGTKYITIFLGLIVFLFILISKKILFLYVGLNYTHLSNWLMLWILTLLGTHNGAISSLIFAQNNLKPIVFISIFSSISSLIIAWFLIPYFQVGGIVLGYLYYIICQQVFYYAYYYKRYLKLDSANILKFSFMIPITKIALGTGIVYFISSIIPKYGHIIDLLLCGILFTIVQFPVIYFFVLSEPDKFFLRGLFRK